MESSLYEADFPFSWRPLADLALAELENADAHNEDILRACLAMDSGVAEFGPEHGGADLGALEMIDQKLKLILDLLGHLMRKELDLPESRRLSLGTREIAWTERGTPPAAGNAVLLELYPYSVFPRPLRLSGRIESVHTENNGGVRVVARFEEPVEAVTELLEKWIFRNHRRQIAQRRQSPR